MRIGRMGRESAPLDRSSPGADVSKRMITLSELSNDRKRAGFEPVQQQSHPRRVIMTASKSKAKV